ncbi:MAG TPA: metal-sensitive transcriptional regulator [Gemmatimonadaceae bacterium]|nr:metal-sensitive transcriptional regulator [Gemmatimonadaceae bacterium]
MSKPPSAELPIAACACANDGARKAVAVDPDVKDRTTKRLRRIEGQVRGLQKMVDEERYCADILTQLSSVHEALRGVARELLRNHLKHCAATAIRSGDERAEAMYDELVDLMYKHSR